MHRDGTPAERAPGLSSARRSNRGSALVFSLIALVILMLGGIALIRSVDTTNVIAGNFGFKQAATQVSDTATELAITDLTTNILATSAEAHIANRYFATTQPINSQGIPTTINWATVPCRDGTNPDLATTVSCAGGAEYRVQYVIERLCVGTLPITDIQSYCLADTPTGGGSKKSQATIFTKATAVYYRITARALGPRNAESIVQTVIAF
jgi:Tfp pilus assembly protein PilX